VNVWLPKTSSYVHESGAGVQIQVPLHDLSYPLHAPDGKFAINGSPRAVSTNLSRKLRIQAGNKREREREREAEVVSTR